MYETFSNDYDRFVNWKNRLASEMPFIEKLVGPLGQENRAPRVLDAACGTGMHAIALANVGFETAGADLSNGMIERARANAQAAGVNIRFETTGFGSLERRFGTGQFDALLCLGNSLPHLLSQEELVIALEDFARCLRPGGLLLIQNRNFDTVLANRERWMEPQTHLEGDKEWLFLRFYDFGPQGLIQFNIITLSREGQSGWRQQVSGTLLYPLLEGELSVALRQAGFTKAEKFGSLRGEPFDLADSGNLVMAAWKSDHPG